MLKKIILFISEFLSSTLWFIQIQYTIVTNINYFLAWLNPAPCVYRYNALLCQKCDICVLLQVLTP